MFENINIIQILTFIGLFYTAIQVYLIYKTNKDNHEWNRRISSQNAIIDIGKYFGDTITELNEIFNTSNRKESIPLKDILGAIHKDKSIQIKIFHILNSYEALARGVHNSIYDEEIIKSARRIAMIKQYDLYLNYIQHRREVSNINAYDQMESLVNKWKDEATSTLHRTKTG